MDTIYSKRTLYTDTDSFEILSLLGQTLDSGIQPRTNQAIREVIRCLRGMNLKLVEVIRECEDTPELRKLAQEFVNDSGKTLEFCSELKNCLEKVEGRYSGIIDALKLIDGSDVNRYVESMQEFKKIKGAGESDPFLELKNIFQPLSTYLLGKLQTSKKRLDKKLKTIQARRRASSIIFNVTLCAAVICSIVTAAVAATPVAAGLAAAGTIPLRSRIKSLWKKDEDAVKGQKVVVESMDKATCIGIQELDQIEVVIKELENEIEPLLSIPSVGQEVIVKIEIEKIKKKMGLFVKNVKDLEAQADMCIQNVKLAKIVVLQKFKKRSKSFNPYTPLELWGLF